MSAWNLPLKLPQFGGSKMVYVDYVGSNDTCVGFVRKARNSYEDAAAKGDVPPLEPNQYIVVMGRGEPAFADMSWYDRVDQAIRAGQDGLDLELFPDEEGRSRAFYEVQMATAVNMFVRTRKA